MWRRPIPFRCQPAQSRRTRIDLASASCVPTPSDTTAHSMSSSQPSGLPDETLQRILTQIQISLTQSSRQLSLVKAQKAAREREKKGVELTRLGIKEETDLGAKSWRGVGKMWVPLLYRERRSKGARQLATVLTLLAFHFLVRFILDSPPAIISSLADQEKAIQVDIDALGKKQKVRRIDSCPSGVSYRDLIAGMCMPPRYFTPILQFLEKQIAESQGHMKDFFRGIEMGQQQQQAGQTAAAS